jgi:hypothetical protein
VPQHHAELRRGRDFLETRWMSPLEGTASQKGEPRWIVLIISN